MTLQLLLEITTDYANQWFVIFTTAVYMVGSDDALHISKVRKIKKVGHHISLLDEPKKWEHFVNPRLFVSNFAVFRSLDVQHEANQGATDWQ